MDGRRAAADTQRSLRSISSSSLSAIGHTYFVLLIYSVPVQT